MDFQATGTVAHPAPLVLETMLERMDVISPFLRNVERIDTVEHAPMDDGRLRIVRRWQGSADAAPRAVRPFLGPDVLAWLDTALWTPAAGRADWSHTSCATSVAQLYECTGTSLIEPDPADPARRTRIRIAGTLVVHPERLPGVPAFLGGRIAPQAEAFIVGLITPNVTGLADGLQRYFDQRR